MNSRALTKLLSNIFRNIDYEKLIIGYGDVIIKVEDEKFRCDRSVLCAFSEYFHSMFNGMFKESYDNKIIVLHDVSASSFEAFLAFVYSGCITKFNKDNILDIFRTGDFLACNELVSVCKEYINQFNLFDLNDNVLEIYRLCFFTNDTSHLLGKLRAHIARNLKIFSEKNELLQMSFNEFKPLLNEYRKSPSKSCHFLHIQDMNLFLDVIIRWVYHSRKKRAPFFKELFGFVNFECVSTEYKQFLSKIYRIQKNTEKSFEDCLVDHVRDKLMDEKILTPVSYGILSSQLNPPTIHVFVNYSDHRNNKFTTIFSSNESEPHKWNAMKIEVECPASTITIRSVALGDLLFFFGRNNSYKTYKPFRVFPSAHHLFTKESRILACPPCNSVNFDMCGMSSNNCIYWYNNDIHNSTNYENLPASWRFSFNENEIRRGIYQYDYQLDRWYPLPRMETTVSNACLIADNNRIYLIGGRSKDESVVRHAQALDCRTPKWQQLPMTKNSFTHYDALIGCSLNENLYVSDIDQLVETYDLRAGKWKLVTSDFRNRRSGCILQYNDYIDELFVRSIKNRKLDKEEMVFDKRRIVSFKNLLWQFNLPRSISTEKSCNHNAITTTLDPYEKLSVHRQWRSSSSLCNAIHYYGRHVVESYSSNNSVVYDFYSQSDHNDDAYILAPRAQVSNYKLAKLLDVVVCRKY